MPNDPSRRLCVVRVRESKKIHYLLRKGQSPVYVRNEDQAIPAAAAELRQLVQREKESSDNSSRFEENLKPILDLLQVTKATGAGTSKERLQGRSKADSSLKVVVSPERALTVPLDYSLEQEIDGVVAGMFPISAKAVAGGTAEPSVMRHKSYFRIQHLHDSLNKDSKWLFNSHGNFGYGTTFATNFGSAFIWSLPDLALEITAAIKAAHQLLTMVGYLGEAQINVYIEPGVSTLHKERGTLPALLYQQLAIHPWPQVIPDIPQTQRAVTATASFNSTFWSRTDSIADTVGDLLNQLLRDMNYGADLKQLQRYCRQVANAVPLA